MEDETEVLNMIHITAATERENTKIRYVQKLCKKIWWRIFIKIWINEHNLLDKFQGEKYKKLTSKYIIKKYHTN